jgi:D-alanyl-lipoteichoic acid acyltransferase DltB (MBOAT superfamily)
MLTMVLGGLWHGAAWTFVLWGFYQGALLVVHKMFEPLLAILLAAKTEIGRAVSFTLRVFVMFQLTCYGWLLFRAASFTQIVNMTRALRHAFQNVDENLALRVAWLAGPLFLIESVQYVSQNRHLFEFKWILPELKTVCYSVLVYLIVFRAAQPQAFIYFQF